MTLIGISGKKHSGKDECYKAIKSFFEQGTSLKVYRLAFADALKEEVARGCGVTVDYIERNKEMFRLILQGHGTDFRRKQEPNYWIYKYKQAFLKLPEDAIVVTPDVRFLNEFELIRRVGGKLWRIERLHNSHNEDSHLSETELDIKHLTEWDYHIDNEKTVQNLHETIHKHLQENITKYVHP